MKTTPTLRRPSCPEAGFTLTEAAVSIAIIAITMTTLVTTMTRLNEYASIARNCTGAAAVAQNQIDLILSDAPFNPQKTNDDGSPQIPPELIIGTHVTNNVPIYREPTTGIVVSGTLTTIITDISPMILGVTAPLYRADVTVNYTYRSRTYLVTRTTFRSSDI